MHICIVIIHIANFRNCTLSQAIESIKYRYFHWSEALYHVAFNCTPDAPNIIKFLIDSQPNDGNEILSRRLAFCTACYHGHVAVVEAMILHDFKNY